MIMKAIPIICGRNTFSLKKLLNRKTSKTYENDSSVDITP
jgi:hypothetical protein